MLKGWLITGLLCFSSGLFPGPICVAQPVDPAVFGERLQRLTATVESLELALASQKRQIDAISNDLQQVREQLSNQALQRAWSEDLKRIADAVAEVDRKRIADSEQTLKVLNELRKAIGQLAESSSSRASSAREAPTSSRGSKGSGNTGASSTPSGAEKAVPYVMKRGQTLSGLLVEFNADARKRGYQALTADQVLQFNSIEDARRIQEGATLLFPLIPQAQSSP